mmetsp:Transcript_12883/g.19014  ORF Transcript_12883/g.19014 Transcript_12883/m.19014 type:complete len:172 (-) Transcript_12883:45-560(-)
MGRATYVKLIAALFIVLVFCFENSGAEAKSRRRKHDRNYRIKKKECEKNTCGHLISDEAQNCVFECISPECFKKIYAEEPLEDGEIDVVRQKQFQTCYRTESRVTPRRHQKQQEQEPFTKDDSQNVDQEQSKDVEHIYEAEEQAAEEMKNTEQNKAEESFGLNMESWDDER